MRDEYASLLYDENFYFQRPEILDSTSSIMPQNSTSIKPPDGLWRPQFDEVNKIWNESADQEYKENQKQVSGCGGAGSHCGTVERNRTATGR